MHPTFNFYILVRLLLRNVTWIFIMMFYKLIHVMAVNNLQALQGTYFEVSLMSLFIQVSVFISLIIDADTAFCSGAGWFVGRAVIKINNRNSTVYIHICTILHVKWLARLMFFCPYFAFSNSNFCIKNLVVSPISLLSNTAKNIVLL